VRLREPLAVVETYRLVPAADHQKRNVVFARQRRKRQAEDLLIYQVPASCGRSP